MAVGLNAVSTLTLAAGLCGWLHYRAMFFVLAAITLAAAARLGGGDGERVRLPPKPHSRSGVAPPDPAR